MALAVGESNRLWIRVCKISLVSRWAVSSGIVEIMGKKSLVDHRLETGAALFETLVPHLLKYRRRTF